MDLIAHKYRVLKKLGQGAMGEVYLVLPPRGEAVALKLLKSLDDKTTDTAVTQFENEFKVLKKISHPNIGKIYDYGYDETLKKVFFTLPWLKGTDIYSATHELPFEKCEELFVQTLRALNSLHQRNLIHCDLKPGNIYVENGKALLIDFGLAGYFGDFIVGTPTYLAPEIYQGSRHTIASDLYAAGVIFYNCLTRTQPFSGKTLQEVYDRHRTLTPPGISEINKAVPKYFSDIVATLLNKKSEERFPNAATVIEEIAAFSKTKYTVETEETLLSYLPTQSELIGRKETWLEVQSALNDFLAPESSRAFHVLGIYGTAHVGKSKIVHNVINDLQLGKIAVEPAIPPFQDHDWKVLMGSKAITVENLHTLKPNNDKDNRLRDIISLIEQKILVPETSRFLLVLSAREEKEFSALLDLFPPEATAITTVELLPYTREETKEYLQSVIGQKEIPMTFIDQFYRNTDGLPGVAAQLIESLIQNKLLFDQSGRWNEDLLTELDKAFDRLSLSAPLEQELERTYAGLAEDEEEVVKWLALCPHELSPTQLSAVTGGPAPGAALASLVAKNVAREENGSYQLTRAIFRTFVEDNLPNAEVSRRHAKLAHPSTGLSRKWSIYHLSLSDQGELAMKAAERLGAIYEQDGARSKAAELFIQLGKRYPAAKLERRVHWAIEASKLLIWLDRFQEATDYLTNIEKEISQTPNTVDLNLLLLLLEKKGLALLFQEKIDQARHLFVKGLRLVQNRDELKAHRLRFENDLAEIEIILGHHAKAIEIFKHTREAAKSLDAKTLQNITNNDLGHVYLQLQDYDQCLAILSEDIRTFSDMSNREPLARALYSYAEALRVKSDNENSIRAFNECVRICKRGHFLPLLLRTYNGLGNLYATIKNNAEALKSYQKALELSVRLNDNTSKSALLLNQAILYRQENNHALATRRLLMAIQVLENKEPKLAYDKLILSLCYNELAIISSRENNSMKALSYQIERARLAEQMQISATEKFSLFADLAELYLRNRLKEPYQQELERLRRMASTDADNARITALEAEWNAIESFTDQESTGKISSAAAS